MIRTSGDISLEIYMYLHFDVICLRCGELVEYEVEVPDSFDEGPVMKQIDRIYDDFHTGVCPKCEQKERRELKGQENG
jgi:hypothetical protein